MHAMLLHAKCQCHYIKQMFKLFQVQSPLTPATPSSNWPGSPLLLPPLLPLLLQRARTHSPHWTLRTQWTASRTSWSRWSLQQRNRPLPRPVAGATRGGGGMKSARRRKTPGCKSSVPPCRLTKHCWRIWWRIGLTLTASPSFALFVTLCALLPRSSTAS